MAEGLKRKKKEKEKIKKKYERLGRGKREGLERETDAKIWGGWRPGERERPREKRDERDVVKLRDKRDV